jgi:putative radical SAM enzyme (TIGR03279 family)
MSQSSTRPAVVTRVLPDSIAAELGFEPGDRLVRINGQAPRDLIDYRFLCADEELTLEVQDAHGATHVVELDKEFDDDLGLEFETALFDGLMQCNNRCPFCFIDQQPPGKRETLYLKDDDYRLSFLYGSYLTLTNLTAAEWDRIAQLRLSPLFVSVHATEPDVRSRLLKNPRAGEILHQLAWFQSQRLQIHAQVVVCPGINDDVHLERTLRDLAQFHQGDVPAVISVAVVPVGLTRFRPSEDELVPGDADDGPNGDRPGASAAGGFSSAVRHHLCLVSR